MLLVSVIIPVYNTSAYLAECLESVLAQSYRRLEVIVVDDGSTDNSGQIVDEFASQDERVKVLHQQNSGVSSARNLGLTVSSGDFVTFVDSDDVLHLSMIERLVDVISGRDGASMAICEIVPFESQFNPNIQVAAQNEKVLVNDEALQELLYERVVNGPFAKLIRRSMFEGIGFALGVRVGEDLLANIAILRSSSSAILISEQLYGYRLRPESVMKSSIFADRVRLILLLDSELSTGVFAVNVQRALEHRIISEARYAALGMPNEKSSDREYAELQKILTKKVRQYQRGVITDPRANINTRIFALISVLSPSLALAVVRVRIKIREAIVRN